MDMSSCKQHSNDIVIQEFLKQSICLTQPVVEILHRRICSQTQVDVKVSRFTGLVVGTKKFLPHLYRKLTSPSALSAVLRLSMKKDATSVTHVAGQRVNYATIQRCYDNYERSRRTIMTSFKESEQDKDLSEVWEEVLDALSVELKGQEPASCCGGETPCCGGSS